jgi:hypothetical protein
MRWQTFEQDEGFKKKFIWFPIYVQEEKCWVWWEYLLCKTCPWHDGSITYLKELDGRPFRKNRDDKHS